MFWVNLPFGYGLEGLPDTLKCHLKAAKKKKWLLPFRKNVPTNVCQRLLYPGRNSTCK